jgi:hypothetical protein
MPTPTQAWTALRTAMINDAPSCAGDDRFVAEDSDPEPLIRICQGCPLLAPCSILADISNPIPVYGVLAGRVRRGNRSSGLMNPQAMGRLISA